MYIPAYNRSQSPGSCGTGCAQCHKPLCLHTKCLPLFFCSPATPSHPLSFLHFPFSWQFNFTQHRGLWGVWSHGTSASPLLFVKNVHGEGRNSVISVFVLLPIFLLPPTPSCFSPITRPVDWEASTALISALVPPSVPQQDGAARRDVLCLLGTAAARFLAFALALLGARRQLASLPAVPRARQGAVLSWQWQSSACKVVSFLKS